MATPTKTPDVTPAQYGAGGLFALVAGGCITAGVTGTDLLAYLGSTTVVTTALIIADAYIRRGRAKIVAKGNR